MEDLYKKQLAVLKQISSLITNYKKDSKTRKNLEYLEKKLDVSTKYLDQAEELNSQLCEDYELEFPNHHYFTNAEFSKVKKLLVAVIENIKVEISELKEKEVSGSTNKNNDEDSQIPDEQDDKPDEQDDNKKPQSNEEVEEYNEKIRKYRHKFITYIKDHCGKSYANIQDTLIMELTKFFTKLDEKHDEFYDAMKSRYTSIEEDHKELRIIFYEKLEEIQQSKLQKNSDCKLPNVKIHKFDGNYLSWLSFRDHFTKFIHLRTDMDKIKKMNYLIAFTSGEAQNLLKNIPIGEDNYDKAWEILNNRYHNKRVLINAVFDKIVNYNTISSNSDEGIKNMHDMLHSALHSITCLTDEKEAFNALLVHLMSQKLDKESRQLFETSLEDPHEVPTQEEFLTFLEKRFKSLEAIKEDTSTKNQSKGNKEPFKKETQNQFRVSTPQHNYCKLCNNNTHSIRTCKGLLNMNVDMRQQTVRRLNLCINCFAPNHSVDNCSSKYRCLKCNNLHHTLLHKEYSSNQNGSNHNGYNQNGSNHNGYNQNGSNQNSSYQRSSNQNVANPNTSYQKTSNQKAFYQNVSQPNAGGDDYNKSRANRATQQNNQRASNVTNQQPGRNYNCYITEGNDDHKDSHNPLLATAIVRSAKNGHDEYLRAIIDPASHATFITEETVQRLNLIKCKVAPVDVSGLGISKPDDIQCMVTLNIKPRFTSNFSMNIEALVMSKITKSLPSEYVEHHNWKHIKNITLADPDFHTPAPIDILLGANHYNEIMLSGVEKGVKSTPLAQQTEFGWILTGKTTASSLQSDPVALITTQEIDNNLKKFFEVEELTERTFTQEEKLCEEMYESTHQRQKDGRYIVEIPFIKNHVQLGESRSPAIARFLQMERKFLKDAAFKIQYQKFIEEYIEKDHMHLATDIGLPGNTYYLPHHAVINESSSTTKLRVVFDASAKTSSGVSLNDIMLTGPTLQDTLVSTLLRWRKHKIAYTADVEKMFRQIKVAEEQQDFQRIVWRNNPSEKLRDYKLSTVTYGTASASYLAIKTMRQIAIDEGEKYPIGSQIVLRDFYVDDCLSGNDTLEEAQQAQNELRKLLDSGGLKLRKWSSNNPELLRSIPEEDREAGPIQLDEDKTIKALGTYWNTVEDTIEYQVNLPIIKEFEAPTKRSILSDTARLFDPLGILAPTIVKAKILLQELWLSGVTWDEKLPAEISEKWLHYRNELKELEEIKIPRWVFCSNNTSTQLHGFCDASELAYSACVYCRSVLSTGEIKVCFIIGKTRVAPKKEKVSLPRLELCGAVLLAHLLELVKIAMDFKEVEVFAWTDSTIVKAWIRGDPHKWKTYVANRVSDVHSKLNPNQWHHVRSEDNPADCASRGINPSELINHKLWWNGPEWLKNKEINFNTDIEIETELEVRKVTSLIINKNEAEETIIDSYSSYSKLKRITAYCQRFIKNCRTNKIQRIIGPLLTAELQYAETAIIKIAQKQSFSKQINDLKNGKQLDKNSNILSFNPFIDGDNILRVGGRLEESDLNFDEKHPIILSNKSALSKLIIDFAHKTTLHGGTKQTIRYIRQKFWIINGLKTVSQHIHHCTICFRCNAKESQQLMGNLPKPRVTVTKPFLHTGVDYAGPFDIRMSKGRGNKSYKGYISIFVCLSTKAIHIEVVSDLTAIAFIAAFKRFIGRRGHVAHMYSDNGTNFVLANKILKQDNKNFFKSYSEEIMETLANDGTQWHFIPPASPHFGGLWEAGVKSVKHHLKRTIGDTKLTFEELSTVLIQIEACLNSRPLCPMNEDSDDLLVLTPGHFLIGRALNSAPEENLLDMKLNSLSRWRLTQRLQQEFWKKWSSDYLSRLQQRPKWMKKQANLKNGDIILLKDEQLPPTQWLLGRVVETHIGKDNLVRAVTIKTKNNNSLKRPVAKICQLPISDNDDVGFTVSTADQPKLNITSCIATAQVSNTKSTKSYSKISWIFALLILFMKIMSAHTSQPYVVTEFVNHPGLHFEDMGRLRLINSDWNIVVYYKLDNYLNELKHLKLHLGKLETLCGLYNNKTHQKEICYGIVSQFKYQVREKEMKNELLTNRASETHYRKRRGLANFVGTLANQFFGILDENFALQYKEDIKQIELNENYLLKLIKNQTTIAESTINIFKESSESIQKKFKLVDEQLEWFYQLFSYQGSNDLVQQLNISDTFSLLSTQLTLAFMNYQNQQNAIIDVILASHSGKIHPLLLTPTQLKQQIHLIRHEIPTTLMIPGNESPEGLVNLYKIMTSMARIVDNYVIIDIKLPLPEREEFQIFNLIAVPTPYEDKYVYIEPSSKFLVTNLQRTLIYQMDDIDQCTSIAEYYFCRQNHPMYNRNSNISRCEIELLNHVKQISPSCDIKTTEPEIVWIQLRFTNQWIFVLDQQYILNLICNNTVTSLQLEGDGILQLEPGCTIKHNSIIITSQDLFKSQLSASFSPITNLSQQLDTWIEQKSTMNRSNFTLFDPSKKIQQLEKDIGSLKADTDAVGHGHLDWEKLHHFTVPYISIIFIIIFAICFFLYKRAKRTRKHSTKDAVGTEMISMSSLHLESI